MSDETKAASSRDHAVRDVGRAARVDPAASSDASFAMSSITPAAAASAGSSDPSAPTSPRISRRTFITWVSASGVAMSAHGPAQAAAVEEADVATHVHAPDAPATEGAVPVHFTLNGQPISVTVDPRTTLLDTVRETLQLTGTKKGCDHGQCGACTVHVDGKRINSCLSLAVMNEGADITTIEGIGQPGHLHPMQQAFIDHDGYQCGYCTSGQIMSAVGLLQEPWGSGDTDVKEAMSGNICRCGAYKNIVAAIQQVRKG